MNETLTTINTTPVLPRQSSSPAARSHQLRKEVHDMLRDVAFVLAQTRRMREEILQEQPGKRTAAAV